jgi:NitT/TauT family transport system permease protein
MMTVSEERSKKEYNYPSKLLRIASITKISSGILLPLVFIAFIILWELIIILFKVPTYILPAPHMVGNELLDYKVFLKHSGITLLEAFVGFIVGGSIGFIIAVILDTSTFLERSFMPYIIAATNIPIVAFAPVVVIYFGFGMESKMVVAAFISFFPMCIHTLKGLKSSDVVHKDLFFSFAASKSETFFKLRLPTALPFIFTALKQTATGSILAAVVAEFMQAAQGLGWLILTSAYVSNMPRLWATVVVCSALAILFYQVIVLIERYSIPWHSSVRVSEREQSN